jgi:hypothetical protein
MWRESLHFHSMGERKVMNHFVMKRSAANLRTLYRVGIFLMNASFAVNLLAQRNILRVFFLTSAC